MNKNEQIEEVKVHLVSQGWQADHADLIIDNIVESFDRNSLTHELSYDEIARNSGVFEVQQLDDRTIEMLNNIKSVD